jgi:TatD DNase family protein
MLDLVDIGVNLAHRRFNADREAVIERARAAGVRRMVITGTSAASSRAAVTLARQYPGLLFATAGIHPHEARTATEAALRETWDLARSPEVRALGECGLDFDRDFSPRPLQEAAFAAQLEQASATGLPVFLHERAAHERFLSILRPFRTRLRAAVVHCFTGNGHELDAYLALDLHIGITGWICDERRGMVLRSVVGRVPTDRLMIETDAPFLAPPGARAPGRRNEPAFLNHVLEAVARSTGRPAARVADETSRTAGLFFGLGPVASPTPSEGAGGRGPAPTSR